MNVINNNINTNNSTNIKNNSTQLINNHENDTISLRDCFEYIQKSNLMNGENQIYCNFCRQNSNCEFQTILIEVPEILILSLKRGHEKKLNAKFQFNEFINYDQFLNNKINSNYTLIGIVAQIEESNENAHFISYCRDPLNKSNWIKYDEDTVTDAINFQEEVINCSKPYLLFYQKNR